MEQLHFSPWRLVIYCTGKKEKNTKYLTRGQDLGEEGRGFLPRDVNLFSFSLIMPSKAFEVVETKLTIKLQKSRLLSFVIAEIWFCLIFIEFPF